MTSAPHQTSPAITTLIEGYKKFRSKYFEQSTIYDDLVKHGQKPKVLAIACCDSRVHPAVVTHCKPGELFVIRNVANLVPPFDSEPKHHGTSAALEFGVKDLAVSDIILFGHSHCGGIRALMEMTHNEDRSDFIGSWMNIAAPAKQRILEQYPDLSLDKQAHHCEKESLLASLANLLTFPWISARVADGRLALHAWYFDLSTGTIETYQPDTESFMPLDELE